MGVGADGPPGMGQPAIHEQLVAAEVALTGSFGHGGWPLEVKYSGSLNGGPFGIDPVEITLDESLQADYLLRNRVATLAQQYGVTDRTMVPIASAAAVIAGAERTAQQKRQ